MQVYTTNVEGATINQISRLSLGALPDAETKIIFFVDGERALAFDLVLKKHGLTPWREVSPALFESIA